METWKKMHEAAKAALGYRKISRYLEAGQVSAAVLSASGKIYVGVCVDSACSLGVCAERSALFQLISAGEDKVSRILCIMGNGLCGAPCGACRELFAQLMPSDYQDIEVMMDYEAKKVMTLGELTPAWWVKP